MNNEIELNENLIAMCEHTCEIAKESNSFRVLIIFYEKSDKDKKRLAFGKNIADPRELQIYLEESEFRQKGIIPFIENANLFSLDFIRDCYNSTGEEGFRTLEKINFKSVVLKDGKKFLNEKL